MTETVVVALSGGVDSAVAAAMLLRSGAQVIGVTMHHPLLPVSPAVERVATHLGISLNVVDIGSAFDAVIRRFVSEYYAGRTPNPCVQCNAEVKFGMLADVALSTLQNTTATFFATGHYARVDGERLFTARDATKDQSYMLYRLRRELLPRLCFPLGDVTKNDVRKWARDWQLPVDPNHESQDICFIPDGDHATFLQLHRSRQPHETPADTAGFFVNADGRVLAPHNGFERFTVGQRKRFGVGFGKRLFVTRIDAATHEVTLGDQAELARHTVRIDTPHWLIDTPHNMLRCTVKVRYRSPAQAATLVTRGDEWHIAFDSPLFGVAPGQSAVLYDGEQVLGGGVILEESPSSVYNAAVSG